MSLPTKPPPAEWRFPAFLLDFLVVVLLCVLVVAFFWRIALAGRVLAGGDVFTYFYPYWAEATRAIQGGRLPLWTPYLFMGAPFLANSQAGVLYPLNGLLWFFLPAHRSVHLSIVLHLCLAGLNAYLWGRVSLRLSRVGAWTLATTLALGGYLGAQVEHVNQLQGLAWLPLALMLYDRSFSPRPGSRFPKPWIAFVGFVVVLGLIFLAGHTQTAFISLFGLAVYGLGPALWNAVRGQGWGPLARRALLLVAGGGLGVALASVPLIPTWELSRFSVRAGGLPFNERVSFSLSPSYLARALLPGFSEPVSPEHIEHVAYVGVVGLALATVTVFSSRPSTSSDVSPALDAPLLLLILGLFLSLGLYNPLYLFLARFVPGFAHFRVPARWLVLYVLGAAALAGRGVDLLLHRRGRIGWRTSLIFTVTLIVLVVWAVIGVRLDEGEIDGRAILGWGVGIILVVGLLWASSYVPRPATAGLLALSIIELFVASLTLPHSRATAPQAFTSLRPAIAHLLSAGEGVDGPPGRFLSMSDITFDPGDLSAIEVIYGPQLSARALYDYVIAAKHKEVLSPNLPLVFGLPTVDGYGGGVLPLKRYVALQSVFLSECQGSVCEGPLDGRLREYLTSIPDGRWLNLFNVRHVITDKLRDVWLDDVFYDLQFGAQLARGERAAVPCVPEFEATALGIVSYTRGAAALSDGAPVGIVELGFGEGITRTFELRAGQHTAEGTYTPGVAHSQAEVGAHFWSLASDGAEGERQQMTHYVTRLRWQEPAVPTTIVVRAVMPEGKLIVRGVSLIDTRTGDFQTLILSDRGRFRLAHSGDVKVYENLDVQPRAFLVHRALIALEDGTGLALMRDETFDPTAELILDEEPPAEAGGAHSTEALGGSNGEEFARVLSYAPERVEIEVQAQRQGYLVLTDAWYPGWTATVDGVPAPIYRANVLFRAVAVDAGLHRVTFDFRPASLRVGAIVSSGGLAALILVFLVTCIVQSKGQCYNDSVARWTLWEGRR